VQMTNRSCSTLYHIFGGGGCMSLSGDTTVWSIYQVWHSTHKVLLKGRLKLCVPLQGGVQNALTPGCSSLATVAGDHVAGSRGCGFTHLFRQLGSHILLEPPQQEWPQDLQQPSARESRCLFSL